MSIRHDPISGRSHFSRRKTDIHRQRTGTANARSAGLVRWGAPESRLPWRSNPSRPRHAASAQQKGLQTLDLSTSLSSPARFTTFLDAGLRSTMTDPHWAYSGDTLDLADIARHRCERICE